MTTSRDPDRLIHAFLSEGEEQLHDQVYDAVRAEIEQKPQRVVIGPWRMPIMNRIVGFGLAAAAVVAAVLIGSQLIGSPANVGGPGLEPARTASPTPEPTPSPSAEGGLPVGPFVIENLTPETAPVEGVPAITVAIPAPGWSYDPEFDVLNKGEEVDNLPEAALLIWGHAPGTGFEVYGDPCQWVATTPDTPATTPDEIATALAAQASRDASEPVDVTIGGFAGKSITLHVPEDASFDPCDEGNFASYGILGEASRYHQGPGQIDELWIVDVEGSIVILDAAYRPNTPAELIEELRAIAESATFEAP